MVGGTTTTQQQAEEACAHVDMSRLRVRSTRQRNKKCGNLESGAWCLPEGDDAKKTVRLPHGQSYIWAGVHVEVRRAYMMREELSAGPRAAHGFWRDAAWGVRATEKFASPEAQCARLPQP